ncbi:transcription elongation factor spt6 [Bimuria novae-zelandiae CBS 107.79]|uniref:Transcription elongation factor Spt6 n=1 Tax=Bimuria novae-zelandiae CBS 107.79 TaxID=1447943 RepID=A0A6A5UIX6_9PLEO|nr:transcription elongation factor spt6 [Bimuria novae-zelandiae CBS 107.79]
MADYVDNIAELGSEEDDEDFGDEAGEGRSKPNGENGIDDSSEEEDDDDEERIRQEGAGFIADEDEDEEEEVSRKERRRRKKRKNREEDEALDEEDLDLIGVDVEPREASQSKFKRLKRGHKERPRGPRGVDEIFSDDEDAEEVENQRRNNMDEFADFIEEDQFEDEIEDDAHEVGQPGVANISRTLQFTGLDEGAEEDYRAAFGDGTEYDWAIEEQERADMEDEGGGDLKLENVIEPSELKERMLTDRDNVIREKDVPERLQLAREPFPDYEDMPEDVRNKRLDEEAKWISDLIFPKKGLDRYFRNPFVKAVRKVLDFMNVSNFEVPFIFNHRKDYLIHAPGDEDADADEPAPRDMRPERLLAQHELWEIFDLDLKFRAFLEKRDALEKHYNNLKGLHDDIKDDVIEDLESQVVTIEEVQELQDYLHFRYAGEMNEVRQETGNGVQKRANTSRNFYERLRTGKTMSFVYAIGITPDDFAKKAEGTIPSSHLIEDQQVSPEEFAEQLSVGEYESGAGLLKGAKLLYTQELLMNPRLRRHVRRYFYMDASIDCIRTEKGMRKITEDHPYYEFKYLRRQTFQDLAGRPDLFLKMLKAEEEGLINVKIRMGSWDNFKLKLHNHIVSDNVSEVSEQWNTLRKEMLDAALDKMQSIIAGGVRESLRARCEDELAGRARDNYYNKLDQAPFKPRGAHPGAVPNVLTISNGKGQRGDAIMWAYVESDGRVLENGKFRDFRLGNRDRGTADGKDIDVFVEVCNRRKPDVIGISGFSTETQKLKQDLEEIINLNDLKGPQYEDDDNTERTDPLEVIYVNDEVARLYYNSARASNEFPKYPPLTRYCIALARYLQNPLAEYASLGRDIVSLPFVQNQTLIPQEKLFDRLENAMVDMVNLVGFNLIEGYDDAYLAKLLPYVCGLGPRKADRLIKAIQKNNDEIITRYDLIGVSEQNNRDIKKAMDTTVFANCSSFLFLNYDSSEESADYLDSTRIHPEDYELARKMVADAMNLDEEDIKAEQEEAGESAVIRRMVREESFDLIHELDLEGYAKDIEKITGIRKRATLETIRAEISDPYEEIRQAFALMTSDEVFTMLTGETKESLNEGMVIPVQIKKIFPDHIEVRLECGVEGGIGEPEFPEGVGGGRQAPKDVFQPHQTVQAKVVYVNRKAMTAQLSLRTDLIRQPVVRRERIPGDWDEQQEAEDKKAAEREKEVASGRPNRVVNHPLFFSFNSAQAEEYLGSKEMGDAVIRPSSKGFDHLAVTWKVGENSFQHIDVLEMNKASEYSVGKQLRVGKQVYSDLDELIVNHVQAMARKVAELTRDERFQKGTKEETDQWLATYVQANPTRSMYAFCSIPKHPGYFWLCFQAGLNGKKGEWPVKVIPNAFEMQKNVYPDMVALKNGFKMLFQSRSKMTGPPPGQRPPAQAIPIRR